MNQERIHALEELGMVWSMCDHVDWEERLEELRQYKQKYGDCLVPNKFPQNPQLGRFLFAIYVLFLSTYCSSAL